ncbi:O-antigen ligase family protein [Psychrobium sp. 1_MG-2023]|uniref:O-antigen ligase family protein n=1 Tax=Psychrobium sp. 1_MG-2023 TaxID=3062624 RepID=UPI000C337CA5|nr:O-antigen ligase family protein [Psychrobium sp. 1_MG-2023]MDP2561328.1 O-antigen ligase family protein [Psychrobium sp. 1_MG-2023]PKF54142.1 oligosaccharide repeat unit polymerase [Alteromonadales bacterium alter-6D02]
MSRDYREWADSSSAYKHVRQANRCLFVLVVCVLFSLIWWKIPHPLLILVLAILPIGALVVVSVPFYLVLLFVVFSFFRLHEVFPQLYSLKIPLLLSLASMAGLIWHIGFTKRIQPWWSRELTLLSIFFTLIALGVIFASNRPIAIEYFKNIYWKIALMTFAITWLTKSAKDFTFASVLLTCSGVLVSLVAISNKLNGIGMVEETRVTIGRAIGSVLGDPNDLALVLMFPAAFAASLALTPGLNKLTRWLGIISIPVLFFAILATQSRGGLLGVLAVFGLFFYQRSQNKLVFTGVSVAAGALLYVVAGISGRSSGGAGEEGIDASAQGRLYAWEAAWKMAVDNPLSGVGIDNFYSNYFYYSPHWDGLNHAVHSTWFGVLAESGFLGLLVFTVLIYYLLKLGYRSLVTLNQMPDAPPILYACANASYCGLIGTVVAGTFLTQGFTWPVYILAALSMAVAQWVKRHQ